MRLPVVLLVSTSILAGCGQPGEMSSAPADAPAMEMAPPRSAAGEAAAAADAVAKPEAPGQPATATRPASVPMLAYRYDYGIEAPAKAVRTLVSRHEAACVTASPSVCQMTGAQVEEVGDDQVRGSLTLRATPAWLRRFREGLESDAKAQGGRVVESTVSSEDLSRQIVDTEAAIRAKTTLRDRLVNLLANRSGKLSELLELERELARVQGEIDATQSELQVMRARVAMSELTISYASTGMLARPGAFWPIGDALGDVGGILAGTIAFMIRMVAVLILWALLIGGAVWVFRKRLPPLRRKKTPPPAP